MEKEERWQHKLLQLTGLAILLSVIPLFLIMVHLKSLSSVFKFLEVRWPSASSLLVHVARIRFLRVNVSRLALHLWPPPQPQAVK